VVFLNVEYFLKKNLFFFSLFFLSFSHLLSYYLPEIKKFDWRNGLYCVVYFPVFQGEKFKILYFIQQTCKKKITSKMECTNQITPIQSLEPSPYLSWMGRYMDFNPLLDFLFFYQTFTFHMHIAYNFPPIFIQFLCIHYILCTSYFYSFC